MREEKNVLSSNRCLCLLGLLSSYNGAGSVHSTFLVCSRCPALVAAATVFVLATSSFPRYCCAFIVIVVIILPPVVAQFFTVVLVIRVIHVCLRRCRCRPRPRRSPCCRFRSVSLSSLHGRPGPGPYHRARGGGGGPGSGLSWPSVVNI